MDRIVLYRGGTLDVEAINSRHQTGGFVPYSGQEQLDKLIYSPALPNVSFRESDWLMQEMRRQDADTSMTPNFNPQSQGGPGGGGQTLGGQQLMASVGELKSSNLVNQMAIGLKDVAKHQLALLRNIADEQVQLSSGQTVPKEHLLGNINFSVKISNVYNYAREAIDSQNRLSQLINFRATKLPEFQTVKIGQFIEDWVRNAVKRENIEDYIDQETLKKVEEQQKQALLQPPQQQAPQNKVSTSISFKDLPPQGQQQLAAQAGIQLQPQAQQGAGGPQMQPQQAAPQGPGGVV
jgi:hypothetical protein